MHKWQDTRTEWKEISVPEGRIILFSDDKDNAFVGAFDGKQYYWIIILPNKTMFMDGSFNRPFKYWRQINVE